MFRITILSVLATAALATHGGSSKSYRKQNDFGHYEFGYDVKDGYGNIQGRQEKGSPGHVVGSYYLGEVDGRHRVVEYVADKLGFRAVIKTNERGTRTSEPAFAPVTSALDKTVPSGSIRLGYADHHLHEQPEHHDVQGLHENSAHVEDTAPHDLAVHSSAHHDHSVPENAVDHVELEKVHENGVEAFGSSEPTLYAARSRKAFQARRRIDKRGYRKLKGGYRPRDRRA